MYVISTCLQNLIHLKLIHYSQTEVDEPDAPEKSSLRAGRSCTDRTSFRLSKNVDSPGFSLPKMKSCGACNGRCVARLLDNQSNALCEAANLFGHSRT